MELDTVSVEVVEHGQAVFVSLAVVGLGSVGSSSMRPKVGGCGATGRPSDGWSGTMVDGTAGPEVFLTLTGNQVGELPLLLGCVQADGLHVVAPAEGGSLSVGEGGTARPPAHQVIPSTEAMHLSGSNGSASTAAAVLTISTGSLRASAAEKVPESSKESASLGGGGHHRENRRQRNKS